MIKYILFYMFSSVLHVFQVALPIQRVRCKLCRRSFQLLQLSGTLVLDLVHSVTKKTVFSFGYFTKKHKIIKCYEKNLNR